LAVGVYNFGIQLWRTSGATLPALSSLPQFASLRADFAAAESALADTKKAFADKKAAMGHVIEESDQLTEKAAKLRAECAHLSHAISLYWAHVFACV